MTDQQTHLLDLGDGYGADDRELPGPYGDEYGQTEIGYDDGSAFDDSVEESFDDWDGRYIAVAHRPPPQESRAWYRDPRWLFGLIALAAAALVVATVLLVTGRGSGEIPTAPGLTTRTPASTSSATRPSSAAPSPSASSTSSSTTSTSSSSPSEEPGAVDVPPPAEPSASAAAPATPSQDKSPAGPRINVTRTPMSFSPGRN